MKSKIAAGLALFLLLITFTAKAQNYRFGLGVRLSNASPTLNNAISAKYFIGRQSALEGLVSFGSRFGVGTLLELHHALGGSGISWFYGGGAYMGFEDRQTYTGTTGILGLDYKFPNTPLNLSLDVKPELDFLPKIALIPDAFSFTARFVFN